MSSLFRRILYVLRQRRLERELDEEMEFHRSLSGSSAFGNTTLAREDARAVWIGTSIESLWQDVRHSTRALRRNPRFSVAALFCTALGVGATTTIFGVVNGLLLHPLPYPQADRLVAIHSRNALKAPGSINVSWPDVESWRQARSLAVVGVWSTGAADLFVPGSEPEQVATALISPQTLVALGQMPLLGRNFEDDEQRFGRHRVAILSHALWQRRYGGDPAIVGRAIRLGSPPAPPVDYLVVGVMPPAAAFPDGTAVWIPLQLDDDERARRGDRRWINGALARLSNSATVDEAAREVGGLGRRLQAEFPADNAGWDAVLVPLHRDIVGNLRGLVLLFQGAAVLVLLIACANVASLMMARAHVRHRELAVRAAIGAGRGRLFRHVLIEALVLSITGGALGLAAASYGCRVIVLALPPGTPSYIDFSIDRGVVVFSVCMSIACGLIFGSSAAWRAGRVGALGALRTPDPGGSDRASRRARRLLVTAEVALSAVLLVGATLLVRSNRTIDAEIGLARGGLLYVSLPTPAERYEGVPREAFYETFAQRIRALPGVRSVGWSAGPIPFARPMRTVPVEIDAAGRDAAVKRQALVYEASPAYFDALGVPFLQGRSFSPADRPSLAPESVLQAVVNARFAREHLASVEPIGARLHAVIPGAQSLGPKTFTIVGVVADFREEPPPGPIKPAVYVYVPFGMNSQRLFVGTTMARPSDLAPSIRAIAHQMDDALPPPAIDTVDAALARALWRETLYAKVLGVFAIFALVLALAGIYAVIAYTVSQRTHEFGIRLALGAAPRQLLMMVVRDGVAPALAGVALGLAIALVATRVLENVLHALRPTDPSTFAGVAAVLGLVALLAGTIPARRAASVDPANALREDA